MLQILKIQEDTDMKKMDKTTEKVTTEKLAQEPTEGRWFAVNPQTIDQTLFQKERKDLTQERTRNIILRAFDEVKKKPKKYGKEFKTMMPMLHRINAWAMKETASIKELIEMATNYKKGTHIADWVEQALEWAQRICNGESWETICNTADTARCWRLFIGEYGYLQIVGGATAVGNTWSPCTVTSCYSYEELDIVLHHVVPLIVSYKK